MFIQTPLTISGGSVDLYYRYGFFSLSVRVIPRDDPGAWLIREPTTGIFEPSTVQTKVQPGPNSFAKQPFEVRKKKYSASGCGTAFCSRTGLVVMMAASLVSK